MISMIQRELILPAGHRKLPFRVQRRAEKKKSQYGSHCATTASTPLVLFRSCFMFQNMAPPWLRGEVAFSI